LTLVRVQRERLDRGTTLVMRIDGDRQLGKKSPARVDSVNLVPDILCADLSEGVSKVLVVSDERAINVMSRNYELLL
jgi:hypothetical protein